MDTIFALATARGRSGVAVVRISGPEARSAATRLAGSLPEPGRAALRVLKDGDGQIIDEAIVLVFASPRSFTGEDVVEFQSHGSPAVIAAIENVLAALPGLRMAEAGEFTRRALENDRLDLAQVEGLGELLSAETESQRQQAVRLLSGRLGERAAEWSANLLRASALIEATIDFADEEVPVDVTPDVRALLEAVSEDLRAEIAGSRVAERISDGFEVAIIGAPNVGKSSLLNYIAGRDVAITSQVAGTTRDILEVRVDLDGLPVTFLDTAGLREAEDEVEQIGVGRTRQRAELADLRIWLTLGDQDDPGLVLNEDDIVVLGKRDLGGAAEDPGVSSVTGEGIDELLARVGAILGDRAGKVVTATTRRHRDSMTAALPCLDSALTSLAADETTPELVSEDIRRAVRSLDSLTGRIDVEAILGEIFSSFCIGK